MIQNNKFDFSSEEIIDSINHCVRKIGFLLTQYNTTAAVTSLEAISPTNAGKDTPELKLQYLRRKLTEIEKDLVPYRKTKEEHELAVNYKENPSGFSDEEILREIKKNYERIRANRPDLANTWIGRVKLLREKNFPNDPLVNYIRLSTIKALDIRKLTPEQDQRLNRYLLILSSLTTPKNQDKRSLDKLIKKGPVKCPKDVARRYEHMTGITAERMWDFSLDSRHWYSTEEGVSALLELYKSIPLHEDVHLEAIVEVVNQLVDHPILNSPEDMAQYPTSLEDSSELAFKTLLSHG